MSQTKSVTALFRRFPVATFCAVFWVALMAGLLLRAGLLTDARALLTEKEVAAQRSEASVRNGAGLPRHLEALKSGLAKLEAKLIRPDNVGPNQQYFYEHESAASVKISILRALGLPKMKGKAPLFLPFAYNVVVEGRFPQVVDFLRALECGEHHYRLVSLTLQRSSIDQSAAAKVDNVVLNINLELLASS